MLTHIPWCTITYTHVYEEYDVHKHVLYVNYITQEKNIVHICVMHSYYIIMLLVLELVFVNQPSFVFHVVQGHRSISSSCVGVGQFAYPPSKL